MGVTTNQIPTLRTARLLFRPLRADDFPLFAEMAADPEVMRHLGGPQDRVEAFRSFCASIGHWTARGYGFWALDELASGRTVGRAGLVRYEGSEAIEVGYALHPSAWGKGFALEAARESLRYAHQVVGARGVVAVITRGNDASIRVVERLGARLLREDPGPTGALLVYRFDDP